MLKIIRILTRLRINQWNILQIFTIVRHTCLSGQPLVIISTEYASKPSARNVHLTPSRSHSSSQAMHRQLILKNKRHWAALGIGQLILLTYILRLNCLEVGADMVHAWSPILRCSVLTAQLLSSHLQIMYKGPCPESRHISYIKRPM